MKVISILVAGLVATATSAFTTTSSSFTGSNVAFMTNKVPSSSVLSMAMERTYIMVSDLND
jgi:hypothetical protein